MTSPGTTLNEPANPTQPVNTYIVQPFATFNPFFFAIVGATAYVNFKQSFRLAGLSRVVKVYNKTLYPCLVSLSNSSSSYVYQKYLEAYDEWTWQSSAVVDTVTVEYPSFSGNPLWPHIERVSQQGAKQEDAWNVVPEPGTPDTNVALGGTVEIEASDRIYSSVITSRRVEQKINWAQALYFNSPSTQQLTFVPSDTTPATHGYSFFSAFLLYIPNNGGPLEVTLSNDIIGESSYTMLFTTVGYSPIIPCEAATITALGGTDCCLFAFQHRSQVNMIVDPE